MKHTRRQFIHLASGAAAAALAGQSAAVKVATVLGAGAPEDRKQAAHRRRRVIYNDDGCAVWGGGKINDTPESFLARRLANVLDSHVDSVYFNTVMWADRFSHVPKVGEFVTESMVDADPKMMKDLCNGFQKLADAGKDALQLSLEFCKSHNIELVWTYRMNDVHDLFEIKQRARFKRDNPRLMLGRPEDARFPGSEQRHFWTALDFAQEAVRKRRLEVIDDVLARYDVDGIDLDFFRTPLFFKSTMQGKPASRTELDVMTGMVKKIRGQVLSASAKRGRPLLLSVRTPVTLELSNYLGLDLQRWLAEGLVDVLVLGGGYMPLTMPARGLIDLGHKHDVPVYPCLSASGLKETHSVAEAWRAAAGNLLADGADGIMTFNYFPDKPSEILKTIGEPAAMANLDKMYGIDWAVPGGYARHAVPQDGALPRQLELNKDAHLMPFPVSDDVVAAEEAGRLKSIDLRVIIDNLGASDKVDLCLNGHELEGVQRASQWLTCNPPAAALKRGRNQLGVMLRARANDATAAPLVSDVQLWVRYKR